MQAFRIYLPFILPLLSLILLILGIANKRITLVLLTLWISIIAILIQYKLAGGEILGYFYDYTQAAFYTLNVTLALIALAFTILQNQGWMRIVAIILLIGVFICYIFLMLNVWINANFIENKLPGSAIMQVSLFKDTEYCHYHYVFYRINLDHQVDYLCPNFYGLIPSRGTLKGMRDKLK